MKHAVRSNTNRTMTPEEAEYYLAILRRPVMYLGKSATFPQMIGFIMGLRYGNTNSHGFGFGTFDDFANNKLNLTKDYQNLSQWIEVLIEETASVEFNDACDRLYQLFAEWVAIQRES